MCFRERKSQTVQELKSVKIFNQGDGFWIPVTVATCCHAAQRPLAFPPLKGGEVPWPRLSWLWTQVLWAELTPPWAAGGMMWFGPGQTQCHIPSGVFYGVISQTPMKKKIKECIYQSWLLFLASVADPAGCPSWRESLCPSPRVMTGLRELFILHPRRWGCLSALDCISLETTIISSMKSPWHIQDVSVIPT